MKNLWQFIEISGRTVSLSLLLVMLWPAFLSAQDTMGITEEPQLGPVQPDLAEQVALLDSVAMEELVGPIALYPDDLVAILLPAATYPLQIVQAARFLDAVDQDPDLQPNEEWDDSVVALLNYPEAVNLLNDDLDWTLQLGNAVINQQDDVVAAIAQFRDRVYLAGNLKSDDKQSVTVEEGAIAITPVDPQVIYVPYYEPSRVVVVQQTPVYYYYPDPYPLYYYPYPAYYSFSSGFFWGVTTAFSIGWHSHHLHVNYPYYPSHRYYDHVYYPRYYVRHHRSHGHHNDTHGSGFAQDSRDHRNHQGVRSNEGDNWQAGDRTSARPVRWANTTKQQGERSRVANRNRSGEQISATYRKTLTENRSVRRISAAEQDASRTTIARTTQWQGSSKTAARGSVESTVNTAYHNDNGKKQAAIDRATANGISRVSGINAQNRQAAPGSQRATGQSPGDTRQQTVTVANARQRDNSNIQSRNRTLRGLPETRTASDALKPPETARVSVLRSSGVQVPREATQVSSTAGTAIVQARSVQTQIPRQVIASAPARAPVSEVRPALLKSNNVAQPDYTGGRKDSQRSPRNSSRDRH